MTIQVAQRIGRALSVSSATKLRELDTALREYVRSVAPAASTPISGSIASTQVQLGAASRILGRITAGPGPAEELTDAQVLFILRAAAQTWLATHKWEDNWEIQLGTGADLRIFHNGTDDFFRVDNGQLRINFAGTNRFRFTNASGAGNATLLGLQDNAGVDKAFLAVAAAANDIIAGTVAGDGALRANQVLWLTGATVASNAPIRLKGYTVATLPAGVVGDYAYVTDALAPAFGAVVAGGGAVVTPVFYNGAAWTVR